MEDGILTKGHHRSVLKIFVEGQQRELLSLQNRHNENVYPWLYDDLHFFLLILV